MRERKYPETILQNQVHMSIAPPLDLDVRVPCRGSCTSESPSALECLAWSFLHSPPKARTEQSWQCLGRWRRAWNKAPVNYGPTSTLQGTLWLSIWFRGSTRCSHRTQVLPIWTVLGPQRQILDPGWQPREYDPSHLSKRNIFLRITYDWTAKMMLTCWFCWHKWFVWTRAHEKYLLRAPHVLSFISNNKYL